MTNMNYESTERLAKLLAEENFTVNFDSSASTASFEPVNRILTFPVYEEFSKHLLEGLACHEIGHAKFTPAINPAETCKTHKLNMGILNIVEDARIEKAVKKEYPGSVKMFNTMYKEMVANDFFDVKGKDLNSLSFPDRINLHYKMGALANIEFNAEESAILSDIDDMGLALADFDDAIRMTKEVQKLIKTQNQQITTEPEDNGISIDGDETEETKSRPEADSEGSMIDYSDMDAEDSDDDSDDSSADADDSEGDTDDKDTTEGDNDDKDDGFGESGSGELEDESDDSGSSESSDGDAEASDIGDTTEGDNGADDEYDPTNDDSLTETDKAAEEALRNATRVTEKNSVHNTEIPDYPIKDLELAGTYVSADTFVKHCEHTDATLNRWNSTSNEYGSKDYESDLKDVKRFVSSLSSQFAMKMAASISSRTKVSHTGMLDINKLFQASYNDDVFLSNEIVEDGKNHGIVLYLDFSGSMYGKPIQNVLRQTMALTHFCRNSNIPFKVFGFTSGMIKGLIDLVPGWSEQSARDTRDSIQGEYGSDQLVELLNSGMNKKTFEKTLKRLYSHSKYIDMCSTPMNDMLIVSVPVLKKFKAAHNLDKLSATVLTDGESHNRLLEAHWNKSEIHVKLPNNKYITTPKNIGGYRNGGFTLTNLAGKIIKAQIPEIVFNIYILATKASDNMVTGIMDGFNDPQADMIKSTFAKNTKLGILEYSKKNKMWDAFDRIFLVSNNKSNTSHVDFGEGITDNLDQKARLKMAKKNLTSSSQAAKINKSFASSFIDSIA